jgi:hypothetical protein
VIAFCCLREITRHLHRGCAKCGEPPSLLVSGLSTGVLHVGNRGYNRESASTVADRSAVVHRCPPAIHRLSTGLVPGSGDNAGTSPPRPPQNLQHAIHTHPQAVDEEMTVRTCPHRFPQRLSTSVRSSPDVCPPLGITPGYDRWTTLARPSRRRGASLRWRRGGDLGREWHVMEARRSWGRSARRARTAVGDADLRRPTRMPLTFQGPLIAYLRTGNAA